jgi:asparagine synthase (glutamine-hydrolysing)
MLSGQMGNMTISYDGLELLPELLRAGRLVRLWRETAELLAKTNMSWRGALVKTFGSYAPVRLWQWANETFLGHKQDVLNYTAIRAERLAELDLPALARQRDHDFSFRPRDDGFAMRLDVLRRGDRGIGRRERWPTGASIIAIRQRTSASWNIV